MHRFGETAFVALVLTPLIFLPGFGEDSVRTVWVAAAGALLAWRMAVSIARRRQRPADTPAVVIVGGAFLLFQVIGLLFAVNPWEGFPRIIVTASALAACLALSSGYLSRAFLFRWGFPVLSLMALGVGFAGLWTLGGTTRAGAVGAMLVPVTGSFVFLGKDVFRKSLAFAGCLASLVLVALSDSRGAMLAAAAGGVVTMILLFPKKGKWVAAGLVLVVAALAWKSQRLRTVFDSKHDTNEVRLGIWPGAWRMSLDRPIVGCGVGGFRMAFPPYRSRMEFRHHFKNPKEWPEVEDAHSLYLNLLAEGGFIVLVAFLWVIYIAVRMGRWIYRRGEDPDYAVVVAGVAGGVTAFLVGGLANSLDKILSTWVLFWLLLGILHAVSPGGRRTRSAGELAVTIPIVSAVLLTCSVVFSLNVVVADFHFQAAKKEREFGLYLQGLQNSVDVFHPQWRVHAKLGQDLGKIGRHQEARTHLEFALQLHPDNVPSLIRMAEQHFSKKKYKECLALLDRAVAVAPFYYAGFVNRSVVRRQTGDLAGAEADARAILSLADTYYNEERFEEARRLSEKAVAVWKALDSDPVVNKIRAGGS